MKQLTKGQVCACVCQGHEHEEKNSVLRNIKFSPLRSQIVPVRFFFLPTPLIMG